MRPSHSGGDRSAGYSVHLLRYGDPNALGGNTPSRFVPDCSVTGRSVFSRAVTHGTPRRVVSSWIPPESVTTIVAFFIKHTKSR